MNASIEGTSTGEKWSKSKKKRMRRNKMKGAIASSTSTSGASGASLTPAEERKNNGLKGKKSTHQSSGNSKKRPMTADSTSNTSDITSSNKRSKKSTLQQNFQARLSGSRFRILNEELYTTPSEESYERFRKNPELFEQYHEGFRHQVESWPTNPVDLMVHSIRKFASKQQKQKSQKVVVADFGCGDAELARQLLTNEKLFSIYSFDLVAKNDRVTVCDMAHLPLQDETVDVGVFCLALMGTNLADFIREAHRVLKPNGILKIAEVRSRFEGKGDTGMVELDRFLKVLQQLGFESQKVDRSNKMFVMIDLRKSCKAPDKSLQYTAKPCIYKRR